jgi:hypothetical protein
MMMFRKRTWCAVIAGAVLLCSGVLCLGSPDNRAKVCRKLQHYYREADVRLNLAHHPHSSHLLSHCIDKDGLDSPEFWIAHGGGVGEFFYTNCKEAVHDSLDKGFTYIEIDLAITTDGHLVGAHTWSELKALLGSEELSDAPMSRADIEALRPRWRRTPLFAEDICRIMQEHPGMVLVTDKVQDFELLRQQIPFADRMIVEAFSPHDCLQAFRAGFTNVALTAWNVYHLHQAQKYGIRGVVLSAHLMVTHPSSVPLVRQLHDSGCCIMVHGAVVSDTPDFVHTHLGRNISRIYTDTWSPYNPPPKPAE